MFAGALRPAIRAGGCPGRTRSGVEPGLALTVPEAGVEVGVSSADLAGISPPVQEVQRDPCARPVDPPLRGPAELRSMASGRP